MNVQAFPIVPHKNYMVDADFDVLAGIFVGISAHKLDECAGNFRETRCGAHILIGDGGELSHK
jgi:hypothetical protein